MGNLFLTMYVLRNVDSTCGFPASQLSFVCHEYSTVRDLQP